MKKTLIVCVILGVLAVIGIAVIAANQSKIELGEAQVRDQDSSLIKIIDQVEITGNKEYVVLYESTAGMGIVNFERAPILNNWRAKETHTLPFERGISQWYLSFAVNGGQQDFTVVYGQFTPAEDYNLPIRLRNRPEGYDEKPLHTQNAAGDVFWYQYLEKPSQNPDAFEIYNEITGTVITQ